MEDLYEILFLDDVDDAQRERLLRLLRDDPEAQKIARNWAQLTGEMRRSLERHVGDRKTLVLEALRRAGREGDLTMGERASLEGSGPALARAIQRHPCLNDVLARTQTDVREFDRFWASELEPEVRPIRAEDRRPSRRPRVAASRWLWRAASGIAIVVFAILVVFLSQREAGLVTVATGPGEVLYLNLADGSAVRLLENSQLSYHEATAKAPFDRFARLSGDAFFDVESGREGFTIETPTAVVVVLGTTFGLRAGATSAEVFLASGRLSVASRSGRDRPVVLDSGHMTRVDEGRLPTNPEKVELSEALAWTGLFVFRSTDVTAAAKRLAEAYDVSVVVDPDLQNETVTGTFDREQPVSAILDALAAALDGEVSAVGTGFRIAPARRP